MKQYTVAILGATGAVGRELGTFNIEKYFDKKGNL